MVESEMNQIFKHIHSNQELSLEEYKTTDYIFNYLKDKGFSAAKFDGFPGLYCDIDDYSKDSTKIGISADLDELWQEDNRVKQANHSCEHDAHISMVIVAMLVFQDKTLIKKGVRFIFQPAEEIGLGAIKVSETGVIDDLDYMFGIHLRPVEEAKSGFISPSI